MASIDAGSPVNTPPRWLAALGQFERVATFIAFTVMVAAIFADVLWREFSGVGLHWARQVGVYANIIVVMLGLGLASAEGAHLRPRFADGWLPAAWDGALQRLSEGLMAAFCALFGMMGSQMVWQAFALQERSILIGVVVWPVMAVIPLAFLIATVRHGAFALNPSWRPQDRATRERL